MRSPIGSPAHRWRASARALAASLLIAALALAPTLGAQRAQLEQAIQRRVLPNGLEVVVVQNYGVPLATISVQVKTGAFIQTEETEGLPHLYEHMFFRSNARHPGPDAFGERASALGAIFNGVTQEERVYYYMTLGADSLAPGLRLMAAALREPLFRAVELAREKEVVLGEYDRNEASPFFQLQQRMGKQLWGSAWPRKNALGRREVIVRATPAQMREFQRRYYVPNNSAVIITGAVEPASVFRLVEQVLGDWPRGPDPFAAHPVPPTPPLQRNDAIVIEEPVNAVTVLVQWHGPSASGDPAGTWAADVFSDVMNQPQSRLQRRLVDTGLWDGIGVNYYTLDHVGPISISGQTTPDKLMRALAALEAEIAQFDQPGYFTAAELEPVKQQRVVGTTFGLERASGFAHQLGFWWSVAGVDYYLGYVDAMAKQTPDDLRRYVRRYIVGQPRVTGVLIAPDARARLGLTAEHLLRTAPARSPGAAR